jgi:hypothetical protein
MNLNITDKLVTFDYASYHHVLIEPGPHAYEWSITQQLKSWLSTNNVKVFIDYDCGDFGESSPVTTFEFVNEADARSFYEYWKTQSTYLRKV